MQAVHVLSLLWTCAHLLPLGSGSMLAGEPHGMCGRWQRKYSVLHSEIAAGRLPARYAVHVSPRSGFSDRLVGMVSVFYYALLTDRAIIFWRGPDAGLPSPELAFDSPWNVNWTAAEDYKALLGDIPEGMYTHPDMEGPGYRHWDMLGGARSDVFAKGDLYELGQDVRTVLMTMHRGRSVSLFSNPRMAARMYMMGLRPETAFGCALNFLFMPNKGMKQMFARELAVLGDAKIFSIGLQIRTGDAAVLNPEQDVMNEENVQCFMQCAEQVEQHWNTGNVTFAWYVLSDSVHVRRRVEELHDAKVLTRTDMALEHTATGVDPDVIHGPSSTEKGFRAALWEQWLLGMTDVQVISQQSGFGRVAAFRSLPVVNFYTCSGDPEMPCGPGDTTPVNTAAAAWSGI